MKLSDFFPEPPVGARTSPATKRNSQPILNVLSAHLPAHARVLEIASGSGQHAALIASALPGVEWTPSDPDSAALESIAAWRAAGNGNMAAPLRLDARDPAGWPAGPVDAVVCINMTHISPWDATEGLMAGAGRVLEAGGLMYLYGPYLEAETPLAPSNAAFDADLRRRNPAWGLRDRAAVEALAKAHGLILTRRVEMPANNLSLLFRRA